MDFGGLLVLGILWVLFNLLGRGKASQPAPRKLPQPGTPPPYPSGAADPTQQEGSRLEQLLRELERNLGEGAGTLTAGGPRLPSPQRPSVPADQGPAGEEDDVEERGSLEEPERVVSLEHEVDRGVRVNVDQEAEGELIARRRVEHARARDRALNRADHKAFDAKIREEPADHTAVRRYTQAQLREAIVWRELLGPPVSERERE
jgi:hypothetical protein